VSSPDTRGKEIAPSSFPSSKARFLLGSSPKIFLNPYSSEKRVEYAQELIEK
jgi:hypothetical protein